MRSTPLLAALIVGAACSSAMAASKSLINQGTLANGDQTTLDVPDQSCKGGAKCPPDTLNQITQSRPANVTLYVPSQGGGIGSNVKLGPGSKPLSKEQQKGDQSQDPQPPDASGIMSPDQSAALGAQGTAPGIVTAGAIGAVAGAVARSVTPAAGSQAGAQGAEIPPTTQDQYQHRADEDQRQGRLDEAAANTIAAGHPEQGEQLAIQALSRQPNNPRALATLAVAQAQQGRVDEAVASAKQALALDPHDALAGLIVGHAEEIRKGGSEAAKELTGRQIIGAYSDPAAAERLFGGHGDGNDARAVYVGGPAGAAKSAPPAEAPLYDTALPLSSAKQLTLKALDLHRAGDDQGALLALTQAIDQEPDNAPAYVVKAEVENALQAFPTAIADAQKAQELAPRDVPLSARALRAQSYAQLQTGDWAGALASASRSVELDGKSGLGYLYRGMAEDKLGRGDAAARDLAQAVSLDGSLRALALPLLKKYGLTNTPLTAARVDPRLLRGGLIAGSLLLVLLGLLGATAGRKALTSAATSWRPAEPAAAPVPRTADIRVGGSVGGYTIVREIGRGGMGVVYEGLDETLRRRVAIKRMQTEQGADLERFLREARLVAQLKHPHIAEIYNVLDAAGEPLLVFEFIEGRGLDQVLRDASRLPPGRTLRVVREVCDALAYAHGRGIIHRDLKPANVMVAGDGGCKVMDFGIAHQSTSGRTMTQTVVCGTPVYMAPEQGFGSVSKASDLFALGVMTYELLTGYRPFDGDDFVDAKLQGRFRPVTELAPALPRALDAFFARALAADASKRFGGAAEFHDAFARAFDTTAVPLS